MATIVLSAFDVANFPGGGGHFWVYMQYAQGLRRLGCEVYWLEEFRRGKAGRGRGDGSALATFFERMEQFGLAGHVLLYERRDGADGPIAFIDAPRAAAEAVLRRADLVLNFHYGIAPRLWGFARRTALGDIDTVLCKIWEWSGE